MSRLMTLQKSLKGGLSIVSDYEAGTQPANAALESDAKMTDDELIDLTAKRILERYKAAFVKLAEND